MFKKFSVELTPRFQTDVSTASSETNLRSKLLRKIFQRRGNQPIEGHKTIRFTFWPCFTSSLVLQRRESCPSGRKYSFAFSNPPRLQNTAHATCCYFIHKLIAHIRFHKALMKTPRENSGAIEASIKVFRRYIRTVRSPSETGPVLALDASGIISKDCFREWKESRSVVPAEPEKTFQRILTAHVTASDGR